MSFNRNQSRALGTGAAAAALALAACSGGGTGGGTTALATPIATITPLAGSSSTPLPANLGVAYLPDGGNGRGFTGVQIVHFEDTSSVLLPSSATGVPQQVSFPGAVGPFIIATDGDAALAAVSADASPVYTIVQSVFGTESSATVPVGTGYNVTVLPTTAPNVTPSPGLTATPIPSPLPVLSAVTSLALYNTTTSAVGIAAGPDTTGFLGLTQLTQAGPVYGGFVPFGGQSPEPVTAARPHVVALTGSVASTALLRGPSDLLSYKVAVGGSGYTFTLGGQATTLGLTGTALGPGVMAIDPADGTRALVGQTNPGDGSALGLTLITGLPGTIVQTSTIPLPSVARSIAITASGAYAVVGTDLGFVVVSGVSSNDLTLNTAFSPASATATINAPSYVGCDGNTYKAINISSVGFSADLSYLAVLANQPSAACASQRTASVVVVPFDQTTGTAPTAAPSPSATSTATAAPKIFVQNNVIAPAAGQDYMFVR